MRKTILLFTFAVCVMAIAAMLAVPTHATADTSRTATSGNIIAADNARLLTRLDSMIENDATRNEKKATRIELLKEAAAKTHDSRTLLDTYGSLFDEYFVFQFDSALTYINKEIAMAAAIGDKRRHDLAYLRKASLLSIGGLYSETAAMLGEVDPDTLDDDTRLKYDITYFYLFTYWADYCHDNVYTPLYRQRAAEYLRQAVGTLRPDNPEYDFYMGEYYIYVERNDSAALAHYYRALKRLSPDSRQYAMASFAIANNYSANGDMLRYEHFLIMACLSDLSHCTHDSQALQDLAMFLFRQGSNDNIEKAERYINFAMTDAKAYNNRLRILEISQKLPLIVASYREKMAEQNAVLTIALVSLTVLTVALVVLLYLINRKSKQLAAHRHELAQNNAELQRLNSEQLTLNDRLHTLNDRLIDTNRRREHLAKIYIDLCADFIGRLAKFELLVKRKIKANQIKDLLTMASSTKMTEEDASAFFNSFDKAFLDLYPTFIDEFNALLLPDAQTERMKGGTRLTTEQRIFALVRLGVTESSEIAALLFYTPRTIYNYRSTIKAKAVSRDTFEQDVAKLCTVI